MPYRYNATGINADTGYPIITEPGWYPFRITVATEGQSKTGNYQVTVDCACLDARWKDYSVRHWVTFFKKGEKGAGMAIHFLKAIGQPYEGQIEIDPMAWERKVFMGKVVVNEYQGKKNNKFDAIGPMQTAVPAGRESGEEDDPFSSN